MKKIILATVLAGIGSTAALAADLGARTYTKAPAMMAAVSNWSGFYIGGNVGYGWGNGNTDISPSVNGFNMTAVTVDSQPKGIIGGGQIGYNWQWGAIVSGFEADIQGSGVKGTTRTALTNSLGPTTALVGSELSWLGTLRGRFGVVVTPDLLLYGTGGLAYGKVSDSTNVTIADPPFNDTWPASTQQTKSGWVAGAGVEWMFTRGWSAKAEYLHVDLGSSSKNAKDEITVPISVTIKNTWQHQYEIVRLGLNYHF
jgi:outer membrane immunogenic protein